MSKEEVHLKAEKIRSEISGQSRRLACLSDLTYGTVEQMKADLYLQNLAKKKFLEGCGDAYRRLALRLSVKPERTQQEENFIAFCQKNKLIG